MQPSKATSKTEVTWASVEDGFYVASQQNQFLGFVDRIENDIFQVFDGKAQLIGLFNNIKEAQECLLTNRKTADTENAGE